MISQLTFILRSSHSKLEVLIFLGQLKLPPFSSLLLLGPFILLPLLSLLLPRIAMGNSYFQRYFFTPPPSDVTFQDSLEILARESEFVSFATPIFEYPFPVPPVESIPPPTLPSARPPTFLTQLSLSNLLSWIGHRQKVTLVFAFVHFSESSCSYSRSPSPE